jgi:hypothetical protein
MLNGRPLESIRHRSPIDVCARVTYSDTRAEREVAFRVQVQRRATRSYDLVAYTLYGSNGVKANPFDTADLVEWSANEERSELKSRSIKKK